MTAEKARREAEALLAAGEPGQAVPVAAGIVKERPGDGWARHLLARARHAAGERDAALADYDAAIELYRGQAASWLTWADRCDRKSDDEGSEYAAHSSHAHRQAAYEAEAAAARAGTERDACARGKPLPRARA